MSTPPLPSWATKPQPGAPPPGSPADLQLGAFIGPRWETYRQKFRPFFEDARFTPTWNWAAALLSPAWFLYRKLYLPFVLFAMLPTAVFQLLWRGPANSVTANSVSPEAGLLYAGLALSAGILAGGTANFLLFRRAVAAVRVVGARVPVGDAALALLRKVGGTSWAAVPIGIVAMGLFRMVFWNAPR